MMSWPTWLICSVSKCLSMLPSRHAAWRSTLAITTDYWYASYLLRWINADAVKGCFFYAIFQAACSAPIRWFQRCDFKGDIFCFHVAPEELLSLLKFFNCFGWFVLSLRSSDIPYLCQSEYKTQFKSAGLLNSPFLEFLPAISLPLLAFNSRLMSQHLIPALIKRCLSGLKPFKYVSPNTDLSQEQC